MDKYLVNKSRAPPKKVAASAASAASASKKQGSLKSATGDSDKYLVGARGYITEHWRYFDDGVVEGVELMYSDGTSTKCGKCTSKKVTEVEPFEGDEHIVGIDFEQDTHGITLLSLYTSRPEGRRVDFFTNVLGDWGSDTWHAPYIGVHDSIISDMGKTFTCKRGKRVTGIVIDEGQVIKMVQEVIPEGQNEKWWEKSNGYKPREKKAASAAGKKKSKGDNEAVDDESPYIVAAKVCYIAKESGSFIVGLELKCAHAPSLKWGRSVGTKKSAELLFEKHEHIVGIDFDVCDEGVERLELFTSDIGGRSVVFSSSYSGGIDVYEDGGRYVGIYGQSKGSLSPKGKRFTCKQGSCVSGIEFKNNRITDMFHDEIPVGCNEKWYEKAMEYDPSCDPNKPKKRQSTDASDKEVKKAKRSRKPKHRAIMNDSDCSDEDDSDYGHHYDSEDSYDYFYSARRSAYNFSSSSNMYRSRSIFGFDAEFYGFGSRNCDALLEQGIKPWDDDAGAALGAMRRW